MADVDRRRFLAAGAAAAVVAFDPAGLGWVTRAQAETGTGGVAVPGLDGELVTDDAALAEAAEDYGQIAHRRPRAVLRPGSVEDIERIVRFAGAHGVAVAMRGQAHSTFGQAQAPAGVVIDSRTLAEIHELTPRGAVVDAGVTWLDLFRAATAAGLTPSVATDYLGLSVGGTLSVGGVGGASSRHGFQVDNVLELDVVTGEGKRVRCSPQVNRDLFEVVLGGLGQYAIIVRAIIRLVPAETTARVYRLGYSRLTDLTNAQRIALADGRFDYLEGQVVQTDSGWGYLLEGAVYYSGADVPDDAEIQRGLPAPDTAEISALPYFDWLNRIYDLVEQLKALKFPSPWLNLFLPDAVVEPFVDDLLATLTPADTGGGPILLYPMPRSLLTRPLVAVPDSAVVFLFAILRMVAPPDETTVSRLLADNRAAYDRAVAMGGKQYPISAIPTRFADWPTHYGAEYRRARLAKSRFDPRGVLAPEQGVFG
ncbi:FAD-binding protein [Actinokineospora iranica]|uniref:FAD/FMN-containing dehydrogenase n=1 Tax=Actinokineospora iranica TaxID=1271860 RepID=A0A1G6NAF1_9PSEU|nr:FAD-binding protein [Actinokineospora iranica]SDC64810.1 FAD/FMN-containing dehydrogenase [Actinokineospora iranica]